MNFRRKTRGIECPAFLEIVISPDKAHENEQDDHEDGSARTKEQNARIPGRGSQRIQAGAHMVVPAAVDARAEKYADHASQKCFQHTI